MALAVIFAALAMSSCGKDYSGLNVRVYALKGPTGMGLSKLMEDSENGKAALDYDFELVSAPAELTAEILGGRFEIAAVPVNLAATLYNKGADISLVAVNTLGVLYIKENGSAINSVSDLAGKTVYATGKGATPEYILRYLIEKSGIAYESVSIEWLSDGSEVASRYIADISSGKYSVAMLPEPSLSSENSREKQITSADVSQSRVALDLTAEWDKVSDTELVQGVIIASNKFIAENPGALEKFLAEYEKSVQFVNENPDEAGKLIEKFGIVANAAVAATAIPNCNICLYTSKRMKDMTRDMFSVLFELNPQSVGGKIPDDAFYYEK